MAYCDNMQILNACEFLTSVFIVVHIPDTPIPTCLNASAFVFKQKDRRVFQMRDPKVIF